jgi:hypothetical protein
MQLRTTFTSLERNAVQVAIAVIGTSAALGPILSAYGTKPRCDS